MFLELIHYYFFVGYSEIPNNHFLLLLILCALSKSFSLLLSTYDNGL